MREVLGTPGTEVDYWIEYMRPKPGWAKPSRTLTDKKKVLIADTTLIVGAGYCSE